MLTMHTIPYYAALKGSPKGSNLTAISLGNRLKDLGITQEPEIRRIVDIMTNPNSLYGTKNARQPVNPYVCVVLRCPHVYMIRDVRIFV